MEHRKGAAGLGHNRSHIEVIGGRPTHTRGVLQSGCIGGAFILIRGVGPIIFHEEEDRDGSTWYF